MFDEVMNVLETIKYRWIDDNTFIQDAAAVLKSKEGNCWEQVELERELFKNAGIDAKSYYVSLSDECGKFQTHTFLVLESDNHFIWFEHSWGIYKGLHEYLTLNELLKDVKSKLIEDFDSTGDVYAFVYQYEKPVNKMKAPEFLNYCSTQTLIKLNDPLYFYHIVDKNVDLSKGLISLKYMYDNKLYDLFDKYADKYKNRIVESWELEKFKGMSESALTREDIIEALEIFRGQFGASYMYFFRYPLYPALGSKISELLKSKDTYRININDEELQLLIEDIFYGYKDLNSSEEVLTKEYYEKVSELEYYSKYDDQEEMNFKTLNHISIAFINDYLPLKFLEKC